MQQIADPFAIPTGGTRYSTVAVVLHWTTAAAIASQILMGWRMERVEGLGRAFLLNLHKSVGIVILLLTACRLAWRLLNPPPEPHLGHSASERHAAQWAHGGFYALLLSLPLTGWALSSLTQSGGLKLFALVPWPAFPFLNALPGTTQDAVATVADNAHAALVWVMLALLALHVLGALKHHFLSRDDTLARMIRGVKPGELLSVRMAAVPASAAIVWAAVYLPALPRKVERPAPVSLAKADLYLDVVQPMLDRRCSGCHSDGDARGAFSMTSYESLSRGGRDGPVIVPGDPAHSALFRRITLAHSETRFMPKGDRPALKPDEVDVVAGWIEAGAPGQGRVDTLKLSDKRRTALAKVFGGASSGEGKEATDIAKLLDHERLPFVAPADPAVTRALEASGFVVRPIDATSNLLDVNFTVRRDLTAADYANLAKIGPQLRTLSIFQGGVKDADLKALAALPNLMRLRLADNPVTDGGAEVLARMPSLRQLTLGETEVGDAGLLQLAQAPAIERIYVWKSKATRAGAERAAAGHPKLKVEVGLGRSDVPAPGPLMQPIN